MIGMADRRGGRGEPAVRRLGDPDAVELLADPDRPRAWTLLVGSTPQSYVDLDDPRYLDFEYMQRLGHVLDLAAPEGAPLRVLHLGGGALSLARYVAATRPGSRQLAVDSDAAVVDLVRERLPLRQPSRRTAGRASGGPAGRTGRVTVRVGDARAVLEELPAGSFDVVIADLFAGARTPAHLTSAEFAGAARSVLSEAGIFAVNIGDGPPLAHARARTAAALAVFAHACLMADAAVLRGRRFGNLVLAASDRGLPVADLIRRVAADPFPARLLHGGDLGRFVAGARPITDATAQGSPAPPPEAFAPS
jgi:Spermine/spermidine synthase domain